MTESSIDDLLRHDDEPPPRNRREVSGGRWWVRMVLIAVALTAVTVFGLRLFDIGVSVTTVGAGFVALLSLRRLTARVAPPPPAREHGHRLAGPDDGTYRWGDPDGLRGAVREWERKLDWAQGKPEMFARGVQPMIAQVVDERLRQRRGFTRASDPARARALLGEPVWLFLAAAPTHSPTPRDCATILAQLEKL